MKKCSWCGAEYPDDVTLCPIDQREVINPSLPKAAAPYSTFRVSLLSLRGDPAPAQPLIRRPVILEVVELFFRYIAALLVSGIVGFFVMLFMIATGFVVFALTERFFYPPEIVILAGGCIAGCVASCIGTFSGALILPRGKRAFGSIAFLVIGAAYCMMFTVEYVLLPNRDYEFYVPAEIWVLWICGALGGMLTVLFFNWGRWPKSGSRQSIVPENAAKISGDLP